MYFNYDSFIDIDRIISNKNIFYAHLSGEKKETLKEHTDLCKDYFSKIITSKELEKVFLNIEVEYLSELSEVGKELFRDMIINTITLHDIGKINPLFQINNMQNEVAGAKDFVALGSKHSLMSSILYIDFFIKKVSRAPKKDKEKLFIFMLLNAYVISRHHGNLDDFDKFIGKFDKGEDGYNIIEIIRGKYKDVWLDEFILNHKMVSEIDTRCKCVLDKSSNKEGIYLYIYERVIFSILVACDFYATTEFMNGVEVNEFGDINAVEEFYDIYKETAVYKSIKNYEKERYSKEKDLLKEKNINILRTEMFLDAEKELSENKESNIFFLEAPTGSGKSNVSMNLSFKLLEENSDLRKIFYVYPFNTLIEQNVKSLNKIFGEHENIFNKISVINSISPIKMDEKSKGSIEEEDDYKYYAKALLNRQFLNYPMVLTTHVSIFNTMFNASKEATFAFHQLANSVIVLDEIQSYKNDIWTEIITFLKGFAKILNMKIIIMSATLPDLNLLTGSYENTTALIKDREKYFNNPLFKNRVDIDYKLIDSDDTSFDLYQHIKESCNKGKKILVEFIKKQSAYDFFRSLMDDYEIECRVELMTGDDNSIERERILNQVSKSQNKGIILIATQVIEAGVDIDMDIGYKDISKLDSDEQFLGRVNRSCLGAGIVYFFNLDDTKSIYKNDARVNNNLMLTDENMRSILSNKNFYNYYVKVLEIII